MKKNLDSITYKILAHILSFTWQIRHLKYVDVYTFWEGEGSEKVYVLDTHLNVDSYGRPHSNIFMFDYIKGFTTK